MAALERRKRGREGTTQGQAGGRQGPRLGVTNHTFHWVQRPQGCSLDHEKTRSSLQGSRETGGSWILVRHGPGEAGVCAL